MPENARETTPSAHRCSAKDLIMSSFGTVVAVPDASTSSTVAPPKVDTVPVKRGRGRPKGSKNKLIEDGTSAKKPKKSAMPKPVKEKPQRKRLSVKAVNEILKAHGIESTGGREVSQCLRAGIMRNKVKLLKPEDDPENNYGLDQILVDGKCLLCQNELKCTVRDVLYQPDYAGTDYEDGGIDATLHCPEEDCGGVYVTRICQGTPNYDSGKFHNHCRACPGFGTCIGDYRDVHCPRCGKHYFNGGYGGKCYKCFPNFDPFNHCDDEDDEEDSEDGDRLPNECSIM